LARLIDLVGTRGDAVRVGDIARDGIQTDGLRRHTGACDIENLEASHDYCPVIAVIRPRSCEFTKFSDAL